MPPGAGLPPARPLPLQGVPLPPVLQVVAGQNCDPVDNCPSVTSEPCSAIFGVTPSVSDATAAYLATVLAKLAYEPASGTWEDAAKAELKKWGITNVETRSVTVKDKVRCTQGQRGVGAEAVPALRCPHAHAALPACAHKLVQFVGCPDHDRLTLSMSWLTPHSPCLSSFAGEHADQWQRACRMLRRLHGHRCNCSLQLLRAVTCHARRSAALR